MNSNFLFCLIDQCVVNTDLSLWSFGIRYYIIENKKVFSNISELVPCENLFSLVSNFPYMQVFTAESQMGELD